MGPGAKLGVGIVAGALGSWAKRVLARSSADPSKITVFVLIFLLAFLVS